MIYACANTWSLAHDAWLRQQRLELASSAGAFNAAYEGVKQAEARKRRLEQQTTHALAGGQYEQTARRMACLRGISNLTGYALAVSCTAARPICLL